jgi:multisubunit Na+/H+ antiporter MnhC subunit
MSEQTHHHHHKHSKDGASLFKQKSLAAIKRRKLIEKCLYRALVFTAIVMGIAVVVVYFFD